MFPGGLGLACFGPPSIVVEDGAAILGTAELGCAGHGLRGKANPVGIAPVIGDDLAAHVDGRRRVDVELSAIEQVAGGRGEPAAETQGIVAILGEPVRRDVAFGAVKEPGDGHALFQHGAGDTGEVAGVEVRIVGDGGGMHGVEEQQGARSAVALDFDELQGGVGCQVARASEGCPVRTGRAETQAAFQDPATKSFRVGEEWRDGAIALDAGGAALVEA